MATKKGNAGGNTLRGTGLQDFLYGLGGNDTLRGLDGDDFLYGGAGNDWLDGGNGIDRVDYRDDPGGIRADLAAGTVRDGTGSLDTLIGVERVIGSRFADTIRGSDAVDSFTGEGGDDVLDGRGGLDFVWYGRALSAVQVDLKNGVATGGEGRDTLISIEQVGGSNHGDLLLGDDGYNYFRPDQFGDVYTPNHDKGGADTIDGRGGYDHVDYSNALSGIDVNLAKKRAFDGAGNTDVLRGVEGIAGSAFDDRIEGNGAGNSFNAGAGADTLRGGGGNDTLTGNAGADMLTGGKGADRFVFRGIEAEADRITDFNGGANGPDTIGIVRSGFGLEGLAAGGLDGAHFVARQDSTAQDADDRFIFDRRDKTLWFDADGTGGIAPVLIVKLQAGAALAAANFELF